MTNVTHPALHLGLIGYPLDHSLSPLLHQTALTTCGLSGDYRLYPIRPRPAGSAELEALLAQMRAGTLQGLNVTTPHKQTVLGFLDDLTPAAAAIGAVNTIYRAASRLVGDNTDAPGFLSDLYAHLGVHVNQRTAIVLGAGGSARAVVYSLLEEGCQVVVAARRIQQARELIESFQALPKVRRAFSKNHLQAIELNPIQLGTKVSHISALYSRNLLIINTTPAGMAPNTDVCPWPQEVALPPGTFIYDLVYNPSNTRLVQMSRSQGIPAASGLGMLVEQAALAFEIWTGCRASRAAMRAALTNLNKTHNANFG
jgi:shikimate dehydrogenase